MTRTKGQDGSDHARLSSDERSQLRSAERLAASFRRRGGGESQCGCGGGGPGIHRRPFLLFLEREEEEKWRVVRAYPLPNSKEVVHTRTPALPETFGVEPLLVIHLEGEIVTASSYAGCAYCLDGTVFRYGCGALNCKGASRPHEDHADGLCGRCSKWACLRVSGTGKSVDMADVDGCTVLPNSSAMEVEFMYQQQLAQSPGGGQEIADSSEKSKMLNGGQRRTKGLLRGK